MAAQFASQNLDGFADIRDSLIHVTDPEKGGIPAAIVPCRGLKLFVNGMLSERVVFVRSTDSVTLEPMEIMGGTQIKIEMDEDGMAAWMDFVPEAHILYRAKDKLPTNTLELEADEIVLGLIPPLAKELVESLQIAGVTYGIDHKVLKQIIDQPVIGRYRVAGGRLPVPAVDDSWTLYGKADMERITLEADAAGRVDFHKQVAVPTTDIGQTVAKIHTGTDGLDGITVNSKVVPAGKRQVLHVQENQFVRMNEVGEIIAKKHGRLRHEVKQNILIFCIQDLLEVDAVNMRIGNLHFNGDIQINENVDDTMEVHCSGNIMVGGSVNFAKLVAGDSVLVKGGLNSATVEAGKLDVQIRAAQVEIDAIREQLRGLIKHLQLRPTAENDDFSLFVSRLLNLQHKDLTKQIIALIRNIRGGHVGLSESLATELMEIFRPLVGDCRELKKLSDMELLRDRFEAVFHQDIIPHPKGDITVSHAVNSTIDAGGNVRVIGNGCTNTTIYADGHVDIAKNFRGGEIFAGGHVTIGEAGSAMGTKTIVHVAEGARVYFKHVHPDTEVHAGKRAMVIQRERMHVQVTYTQNEGFQETSQFGRKR